VEKEIIALGLYAQEKANTCALACLRMVLAAFGTEVEERAIEANATLERRGTLIDEVQRLARLFKPVAEIQETTVDDLRSILAEGKLPIAFIDRAIFDLNPAERSKHRFRDAKIHTVIPVHVTHTFITFHDPLVPAVTRRTIRLFRRAYDMLGGHSVVCSKPAGNEL
jgi:hypothetical protein